MKELLRLLDLHAGRSLKICLGDHPFYLSSTVVDNIDGHVGESKVMIEDAREGLGIPEKVVSGNWTDIALFINDRYPLSSVQLTVDGLYMEVLNLVVQEFSKPMIPFRYANSQFLKEALDKVIEGEPLIQTAISGYK